MWVVYNPGCVEGVSVRGIVKMLRRVWYLTNSFSKCQVSHRYCYNFDYQQQTLQVVCWANGSCIYGFLAREKRVQRKV